MRNFILLASLFLGLALFTGCKTGNVTGTVTFHGVPCPPESNANKVPPCQGPYPHYEVKIYEKSGAEIEATTQTDEAGMFSVRLPPGQYKILAQNGITADDMQMYDFAVEKGKKTVVDITVNTGIQ
jgi:hypothetical protein